MNKTILTLNLNYSKPTCLKQNVLDPKLKTPGAGYYYFTFSGTKYQLVSIKKLIKSLKIHNLLITPVVQEQLKTTQRTFAVHPKPPSR